MYTTNRECQAGLGGTTVEKKRKQPKMQDGVVGGPCASDARRRVKKTNARMIDLRLRALGAAGLAAGLASSHFECIVVGEERLKRDMAETQKPDW